jgi:pimeloyl-ACP methyl ester carboxylesterase
VKLPELFRDIGIPAASQLESRWTLVNGLRLHTRSNGPRAGDGVPFLLIHGLVISSLYMIPLAEEIAATGAEVHAIDLPGFGRSEGPREVLSIPAMADWVIAWMSETGIARCHVIGNSLGCEIAAHLAIKTPDRIATVTMTGPTLDPQALAPITQTLRLCRDALREPFSLWCNWAFDFFRAGARRAFGTTREMFRDHIECQLPHVTTRTLVIRGGTDPTVPQSAAVILAGLLPNGELLVIDGEPHCVHYTDAPGVWRAIQERLLQRRSTTAAHSPLA